MKKVDKKTWVVILSVAVVVLLTGTFFLIRYFNDRGISRDELLATRDEPSMPELQSIPPTQAPTINSFGYKLAEYKNWRDLDFGKLNKINPDIYAWIYIPGTNVDYPVLQSIRDKDDSFYLSHNIYREYQFSGSIYSEIKNKRDFSDPVTVLYGHNMLNGSMFATLHNFEDKDFYDKHTTCFVQTKDNLYTYLIYAAYTYDDRHILNSFNFKDEKVRTNYFNFTLDPRSYDARIRTRVKLDKNSKIITLSTCSNGGGDTRYLVQGVLVNVEHR